MEATILDLRRRTREVLDALERGEPVTITYRGKKKGLLRPIGETENIERSATHPAFGMWRDREELDVAELVRDIRKGRADAR